MTDPHAPCVVCSGPVIRRRKEGRARWAVRKTCSVDCGRALPRPSSRERRVIAGEMKRRFGVVTWAGCTRAPVRQQEVCSMCGGNLGKFCIGVPGALLCSACAEQRAAFDPQIAAAVVRGQQKGMVNA